MRHAAGCLVTLAVLALSPGVVHPQRYVVQDLPLVSPFGARVFDLNDAGTAVGHGLTPALQQHALVWPGAGVVDLTPGNPLAEAQGISAGGLVAGWAQNAAGRTEAARWVGGERTFLGMLPGHVGSLAQDVNDAGLVAGWSVTSVGDPVASVWSGGTIQAIAGTHSWAFAVSETGDVVGRQWVGVDIQGFRWRGGQFTVLPDLGPNNASAVGISPLGRIAGSAQVPGGQLHGVVWEPDLSLTDLGPFLGSFSTAANDVNDAGVAVGLAVIDPVGEIFYATVWRGAGAEDLNTLIPPGSGWELFNAQAVNARGEIVGTGIRNGFGGEKSFLLRPDCDGDGLSDLDEISAGTEYDANEDGLADACQHCQPSLGFAGPGSLALTVCGDPLTAEGSAATLLVAGVAAGAPVFLVAGFVNQPTPLLGGTLVPVPPTLISSPLFAAPGGALAFPLHGSAAPPSTVYLQAVALVGAQAQFSNALELEIGL